MTWTKIDTRSTVALTWWQALEVARRQAVFTDDAQVVLSRPPGIFVVLPSYAIVIDDEDDIAHIAYRPNAA